MRTKWTEIEDVIVMQGYGKMKNRQLLLSLPNRTESALKLRARHLDVNRRMIPDQNGRRWCHECQQFLLLEKFRDRTQFGKQHRLTDCIECMHTKDRKRHKQLRLTILQYYSAEKPFCACCGEGMIEFLAIDHMDNNGAEHRREIGGGTKIYQWLKQNDYPEGFQVLCHNCNLAKGFYGKCPHQD